MQYKVPNIYSKVKTVVWNVAEGLRWPVFGFLTQLKALKEGLKKLTQVILFKKYMLVKHDTEMN